ncbi:response regulator [Thalassolituus oleivorans]|jgi:two-component system sensor histidine kinase BarA|uniref:response regulator n=1 Tax=Thalassolituus oleivorans TaxID=187493 RepID=UPI00042DCE23|nr:response regulator [Thalassolituus oleivorans]AHK16446.1 histidine kinase [Thalassolituus oleivorans R6-15]MBQ0727410.1 response regulator [Thalassolituus oleivorans]MDF1639814.1 response regulator [Thalassolituus oleivorans]PHQ83445.1 MAG: hybrid sensor histidine kinase/response regulator [Thalassobium sp.]
MKNWNIQNRILFLALLPGIIVSLVLGTFFITERARDLGDLLEQRTLAMAKQLAPTCEYGVMTGSVGILQNIANNMLEEIDVRAVTLYNQDMQTLAHAGPRMLTERFGSAELKADQLQLMRTDGSLRARAPIFSQNLIIADQLSEQFYAQKNGQQQLLGWAEVELSGANTKLNQYQHIASSLSIIVSVLILCTVLALRISKQVSQPMGVIVDAIDDMKDGKLETRVHIENGGEFQALASGINAMASALQRANTEHQQNLEQATHDLQETLDELEIRNRELTLGRKEAIEASRMKSEFLANVSHEIRTPLNGILGFSELLGRTQVSERQNDYLQTIRKSSDDLLNIINDILDLSKIDAGKLIIEHTPFNLRDVIEDALQVLAPEAVGKRLELNQIIESNVPLAVCGDPLRLKQVITNLVNNAIKFTEYGSVTVKTSLISQKDHRASLQFEIRDTGLGLSPEKQEKLFQAFSQADASVARQFGGTGLGLIISKALVEAMHGDIRVESREGFGSSFFFNIDIQIDQDSTTNNLAPLDISIAVIDPKQAATTDLLTLLTSWQVDHHYYPTIPQVVDRINSGEKYDLILCAIDHEKLDDDALALLNALKDTQVPVVALVNSVSHEDLDMLKKLGANEALSRPVTQRKLHAALSELVADESQILTLTDPAEEHSPGRVPPCILAVDDNHANLKLVVTLLREMGIQVYSAMTGSEAIAQIDQHPIEMVFMDIQMPNMSGTEATEHIRRMPGKAALPIIALTAHAMADEKQALLKSGMNDYQTKPITQEQLAKCVERWTGYRAPINTLIRVVKHERSREIASEKSICREIFNADMALHHANNNIELAVDMFQMLLDSLDNERANIVAYWEEEALDELLEAVHRMHGATRYCGTPCLRLELETFESALKANEFAKLPEQMRRLVTELDKLQEWVEANDWSELLRNHTTINANA